MLNPKNESQETINFCFRDPTVRESMESLMSADGYIMTSASTSGITNDVPRRATLEVVDKQNMQNENKHRLLRLPTNTAFDWERPPLLYSAGN